MLANVKKIESGMYNKNIVFGYGRFNPPTVGHELLVSKIVETANLLKSEHVVFLSQSHSHDSNPLDWEFKRRVCKMAFPNVIFSNDKSIKTPFQALEKFQGVYKKVILVVGSDRVSDFAERMSPYANKLKLDFEIISAGARIKDAIGIEGVSATKIRQFALDGKRKDFFDNLPSTLPNKTKMFIYKKTLKGMLEPKN